MGDLAALKRTTDQLDQLVRGGRSRPPTPLANNNLPPHPHMHQMYKSENEISPQVSPYNSGYGLGNLHLHPHPNPMPTPPPSTTPPIAGLPPLARNVIPRVPVGTYQPGHHSSGSYSRSQSPLSGEGGGQDGPAYEMNSPVGPAVETSSIQDRLYGGAANRFGRGYSHATAYNEWDDVRVEEEASP